MKPLGPVAYASDMTGIPRKDRVQVRCFCGRRLAVVAWTTDMTDADAPDLFRQVRTKVLTAHLQVVDYDLPPNRHKQATTGESDGWRGVPPTHIKTGQDTSAFYLRLRCKCGRDHREGIAAMHAAWLVASAAGTDIAL